MMIIPFLTVKATVKATDTALSIPWPHVQSFYYDYKARKAINNKNPELALEYNLKILENDPQSVQIHSNLGIIFDQLQKKDESGKSFQQSLELVEKYKNQLNPADIFLVYYNLGAYYGAFTGADQKIAQALEFYQKALEINPTSKETKHNIELLIQKQQQGSSEDKKDGEGQGDKPKDDQNKPPDPKDPAQGKDRKETPKYQPRPFKGEQLSEADVKKILGELSQQDKKIRSNFNKKDRKEDRNDKDW